MFLTLLLLINISFQELLPGLSRIRPSKPGFYEIKLDENNEIKFEKLKSNRHHKHRKSNEDITAWDFRLVTGSTAMQTVKDQGSCGGCWAFSSSDVLGAALYLNNNGSPDVTLSPEYLVDCYTTGTWGSYNYTQGGCNGGYPIIAFLDFQKKGDVTEKCLPWKKKSSSTGKCATSCTTTETFRFYNDSNNPNNKKFKLVDAYQEDLKTLRDLVTNSGPCVAEMKVYDDLSSYTGGVYTHQLDSDVEGHAIAIYGFGVEDGMNYWLVKNSWGKSWGDGGYFKIRMGVKESGIEDNFYALFDNSEPWSPSLVPRPTQPDKPTSCWDDFCDPGNEPDKGVNLPAVIGGSVGGVLGAAGIGAGALALYKMFCGK